MTVTLRGHHLLCILTFKGRGYTPAFIANMRAVVARIGEGETITLMQGPDDLCAPMLDCSDCHCHQPSVVQRDELAVQQISYELGQIPDDFTMEKPILHRLRAAFAQQKIRKACIGCEWFDLCTNIANENFVEAQLQPTLS